MKSVLVLVLITLASGCASVPKEYLLNPTEISDDPSYGYTEENPIAVGGIVHERGPRNEAEFLSHLTNDVGENPKINRKGSCCSFRTPFGYMGRGLLDRYELTFESTKDTVVLYLNMYDYDQPKAPKGLKIKGAKL